MKLLNNYLILSVIGLTFCLGASAQDKKGFDRGYSNEDRITTFVPKGSMSIGIIGGYNDLRTTLDGAGYDILTFLSGMQGNLTTYNVTPNFAYAFAKNAMAGARLSMRHREFDLDNAQFKIDDDNSFDFSNHYMRSNEYSAAAALRYYVPLFGSNILAMFYELRLTGTYQESKSYTLDDVMDKIGAYTKTYGVEFGLYPGVTCFVTNNFALEVNLNMLKLAYDYSDQTRNQVEKSYVSKFATTYKVNLLSLNFGLSYFFGQNRGK